jgi:hypothetical protein
MRGPPLCAFPFEQAGGEMNVKAEPLPSACAVRSSITEPEGATRRKVG